jgi:RNA polymerase sigma-70 factor (sigma-E family)
VQDSDDRAFEEFVARSSDRLLRSAVLLVGRAGAEDLLQGALERTYRHWPRISTGATEAYVRRAMVNSAVGRWRLRRPVEVPLDDDLEVGRGTPDHGDLLASRDELMRALMTLPARQRAVLVLRYFEDMSEAEIAATLRCGVGSVKKHASRGLARLRTTSGTTGNSDGGVPVARRKQ